MCVCICGQEEDELGKMEMLSFLPILYLGMFVFVFLCVFVFMGRRIISLFAFVFVGGGW